MDLMIHVLRNYKKKKFITMIGIFQITIYKVFERKIVIILFSISFFKNYLLIHSDALPSQQPYCF